MHLFAQAKALGLLSDRPAKQQQALPTAKTQEHGNQQAADLAKAGICRCVEGQLLPSDCKGTCVGSICLGYCKTERPIADVDALEFSKPMTVRLARYDNVLPGEQRGRPRGRPKLRAIS